jgi:hypothetical protein
VRLNLLSRWSLALASVAVVPLLSADDAYVAEKDGTIQIGCACVVGFAGCELKLFDELRDKPRQTWTQPANVKAGTKYNLDQLCYRKRDVDEGGEGLCCTAANEEDSIKRLFRGTAR